MLRDQGHGHIQTRTVLLLSYFLRVNIHQLHSTTGCCVLDFVAVWACFVTNETRFLNTAYTVFICKRSEYKNRCICFWYLITDIAGSCLLIPSVYMQCSNSSCHLLSHSRFCNAAWLKNMCDIWVNDSILSPFIECRLSLRFIGESNITFWHTRWWKTSVWPYQLVISVS